MARTFAFPLSKEAIARLRGSADRVVRDAAQAGVTIKPLLQPPNKVLTGGAFSNDSISGTFALSDEAVVVTVDKKPFIAPWGLIESRLREVFAKV